MSSAGTHSALSRVPVYTHNPFWRWAVFPLALQGEPGIAAIPFWSRRTAERAGGRYVRQCGGGVMLLRRRGWRTYELAGHIR